MQGGGYNQQVGLGALNSSMSQQMEPLIEL